MTHPKQALTLEGQAAREAFERTIVLGEMRETSELAWQAAAAAVIEAAITFLKGLSERDYASPTPPTENKDERIRELEAALAETCSECLSTGTHKMSCGEKK